MRSEAATFSTSSGRFGSCCSPGNVSSNRGAQFPSPGIPKRLRSKGVSQSLIRGLFVGSVIRQSPDSFMSHQLVTFPDHRTDIVHNCEHFWPSPTAPPVSTMVNTSGGTGKCHPTAGLPTEMSPRGDIFRPVPSSKAARMTLASYSSSASATSPAAT